MANKDLLKDPAVKWAAIGLAVFVVGKAVGAIDSLAEAIGIKDSQETKDLDNAAQNSSSYWSPNFWRNGPTGKIILTSAAAHAMSDEIYNSFGVFNDDEDRAKGVIRSLKTQSQLSYLADVFNQVHKQDLLSFLRGGSWPQDRLSDDDVAELNRFISSLPKYFL